VRKHKVYNHETKGYTAVKLGFAWYGFLFNVFWLIFKSLFFRLLFFIFLLTVCFSFSGDMISKSITFYSFKDWVIAVMVLLMPFWIGFRGNQWISNSLENQGYQLINTLPITSKKEAIIQTKLLNSNKNSAYAAWGLQDSYQPGHRHIKKE
jgi:hypothetical protein